MSVERARNLVNEATGIPFEYLTERASMHRTPMWDSLMSLRILLLAEERFGAAPPDKDFSAFTSIASLAKVLDEIEK